MKARVAAWVLACAFLPWCAATALADGVPRPETERWVQWPGIDGRLHRSRIAAANHMETFGFIEKSMGLDRQRLTALAAKQLRIEFAPFLDTLPVRLSAFFSQMFSYSGVSALLQSAFSVANTAVSNASPEIDRMALLSEVENRLVQSLARDYQSTMLDPTESLPRLRMASQKVFAGLRRDLLHVCGVYDQAFHEMILKSHGLLETFDNESLWRSNPLWRAESATFQSLCGSLRRADGASYEIAQKVLESLGELDDEAQAVLRSIVRPLAESVVDLVLTTQRRATAMNHWGVPMILAHWSAKAIGFLGGGWGLTSQWWERLEGVCGRLRLEPVLYKALRAAEARTWEQLKDMTDDFVAAEIASMTLALQARQYKGEQRP